MKALKAKRKLSAQEKRDLDFEIAFMERIIKRDPKYVEALQVLGADYTQRGDYESGLKVDRKLARLNPADPTILYNLACSYALTLKVKQAVRTLRKAVECGFDDYHLLTQDPDLEILRGDAAYEKIRVLLLRPGR